VREKARRKSNSGSPRPNGKPRADPFGRPRDRNPPRGGTPEKKRKSNLETCTPVYGSRRRKPGVWARKTSYPPRPGAGPPVRFLTDFLPFKGPLAGPPPKRPIPPPRGRGKIARTFFLFLRRKGNPNPPNHLAGPRFTGRLPQPKPGPSPPSAPPNASKLAPRGQGPIHAACDRESRFFVFPGRRSRAPFFGGIFTTGANPSPGPFATKEL